MSATLSTHAPNFQQANFAMLVETLQKLTTCLAGMINPGESATQGTPRLQNSKKWRGFTATDLRRAVPVLVDPEDRPDLKRRKNEIIAVFEENGVAPEQVRKTIEKKKKSRRTRESWFQFKTDDLRFALAYFTPEKYGNWFALTNAGGRCDIIRLLCDEGVTIRNMKKYVSETKLKKIYVPLSSVGVRAQFGNVDNPVSYIGSIVESTN